MKKSARDRKCVVFGAGALGLGFLGPELAPYFNLIFVDIASKSALLDHLARCGHYRFNETGPASHGKRVENVSGASAGDEARIRGLLEEAELAVTSVGEANLEATVPHFASALASGRRKVPLRVLCSENGIDVAAGFRSRIAAALGGDPGEALVTGDTVMGRMCRLISPVEEGLVPVADGLDIAVAAEPYYGIPVPSDAMSGMDMVPETFHCMSRDEFEAHEDLKLLAHNGLHAFLSFLASAGGDAEFFCELAGDRELMLMAHAMLHEEVAPALISRHGEVLDRNHLLNYLTTILRRITCRGLHDTIERGTRGAMRKLQPGERLVGSVRAIFQAGVMPRLYAAGLAAAAVFAVKNGETDLSFEEILLRHCGLDADAEQPLIELILDARDDLCR